MTEDTIVGQIKILRVFRLIDSLIERPLTPTQIAREMGIADRTAHRYIYLLRDLGFEIIEHKKPFDKRSVKYSIGSKRPKFMDFLKNVA